MSIQLVMVVVSAVALVSASAFGYALKASKDADTALDISNISRCTASNHRLGIWEAISEHSSSIKTTQGEIGKLYQIVETISHQKNPGREEYVRLAACIRSIENQVSELTVPYPAAQYIATSISNIEDILEKYE